MRKLEVLIQEAERFCGYCNLSPSPLELSASTLLLSTAVQEGEGSIAVPNVTNVYVSSSMFALSLSNGSLVAFHSAAPSSLNVFKETKQTQTHHPRGGLSDEEITDLWKHVQGVGSMADPVVLVADPGAHIVSAEAFMYKAERVFSSSSSSSSNSNPLQSNKAVNANSIQSFIAVRLDGEVLLWMRSSDLEEGAAAIALETATQSQQQLQQQQQQKKRKQQQSAVSAPIMSSSLPPSFGLQAAPSSSLSSTSPLFQQQREEKKEAYGGFALVCSINVFDNDLLPITVANDSIHRVIRQAQYNVSSETLFLVCETENTSQVFAVPLRVYSSNTNSGSGAVSQRDLANNNNSMNVFSQHSLEVEISESQCLMSRPERLSLLGSCEHGGGVFITSSSLSSSNSQEVSYYNHSSSRSCSPSSSSSSTSSSSAFQSLTLSDATVSSNSNDLPPIHLPVLTTSTLRDLFSRERQSVEEDPNNDSTGSFEGTISTSSIGTFRQMFFPAVEDSKVNDFKNDDVLGAACFVGGVSGSGSSIDEILVVSLSGKLFSITLDEKTSVLASTFVSSLDTASHGWADVVEVTGMTTVGPSVYFTVTKKKKKASDNQTSSTSKHLIAFDIASGLSVSSIHSTGHILWRSSNEYISGCLFTAPSMKSGIKSQRIQIERFGPHSLPEYSRRLATILNRGTRISRQDEDDNSTSHQERLAKKKNLLSKSYTFRIAYGEASNALSIFNGELNTDEDSRLRRNLETETRENDSELVSILRDLIKDSWLVSGCISPDSPLSDSNILLLNTAVAMSCDALEWAISLRDSGLQDDLSIVRSIMASSQVPSSSSSLINEQPSLNSSSADFLLNSTAYSSSSSSSPLLSASLDKNGSSRLSFEFLHLTLSECFTSVSRVWARLVTLAPGLAIALGVGANISSDDCSTSTASSAALHSSYVAPSFALRRTVQLLRSIGVTKQQLEWTVGLRLAGDGTALPQKQSRLLPPIAPPPPPSSSSSDLVSSATLPPVAGVPSGKGVVKVKLPSKRFFETTSDLIDDILAISHFVSSTSDGATAIADSGVSHHSHLNSHLKNSSAFESRLFLASNNPALDRSRDASTESAVQTFYDNRAGDNIVQKSSDDDNHAHTRRDGGGEADDDGDNNSESSEDALWDAHVPSELQSLWAGSKQLHLLLLPQILTHLKTQLHVRALIGRDDAVDAPMSRAHAAIVLAEDNDADAVSDEDSITGRGNAIISFPAALATGGGVELSDNDLIQLSERASHAASVVFSGQMSQEDLTVLRIAREAFFRLRVSLTGYKEVLTSDIAALARSLIHPKRKSARKLNPSNSNPDAAIEVADDELLLSAPSLIAEAPINFELVVRFAYASSIYSWHSIVSNSNDAGATSEEDEAIATGASSSSLITASQPHYSRAQSRAISIHAVDVLSLLEAYHSQVPATWRGELPPAIKSHMRLEATQKKINVSNGTSNANGFSFSDGNDQQQKQGDADRFIPPTDSYKNTFIRALKALPLPRKVVRQKDAIPLKQVWAMRAASELLFSHRSQPQQFRGQTRTLLSPQQQVNSTSQPQSSMESPSQQLRSKSPGIPSRKSSSSKHGGPLSSSSSPSAPFVSPQTLIHARILCRVGEFVDALRLLLALDHWEAALSMLTTAEEADGFIRSNSSNHTSSSNSSTLTPSSSHASGRGVSGIDARGSSIDLLVSRMVSSHSACMTYLEALEGGETAFEPTHPSRQGKTLKDMESSELLLSYSFLQRMCENPSSEWADDVSFLMSQNLIPSNANLQPANAPPAVSTGTSGISAPSTNLSAAVPPALIPSTFTSSSSSSRRMLQPSTIATQSRLSAMSPSIASVSSLLRWSSSALKRAMCWKAVFKHAVEAGCAARVLMCWRRLPPAMSLTSLLALLKSCLANEKSEAHLLPAWAVLTPLVVLSHMHAEEVEGMFRHMRSQAMQKSDGNHPLRTWNK